MLNWFDHRISQWQLWYFRMFKMRSMPRPPEDWIRKEQEERKRAEKRQEQSSQEQRQRRDERKQDERKQDERKQDERKQDERKQDEEDRVPKSWLYERISLQQAEADNSNREGGVPFGEQNDRWERLKACLHEGDEIWAFCSPSESWEQLAGRAGLAVVRNGRVVKCLVTKIN
jgi:hypothetical protein